MFALAPRTAVVLAESGTPAMVAIDVSRVEKRAGVVLMVALAMALTPQLAVTAHSWRWPR